MNPNTATALAYLLAEVVRTGLTISDVLIQVDDSGALPAEKVAEIKAALKADFAKAREFWG